MYKPTVVFVSPLRDTCDRFWDLANDIKFIPIPGSTNNYSDNVAELLKQQSEKSSKLLPAMLKKIEDIRSGWNTNTNAS